LLLLLVVVVVGVGGEVTHILLGSSQHQTLDQGAERQERISTSFLLLVQQLLEDALVIKGVAVQDRKKPIASTHGLFVCTHKKYKDKIETSWRKISGLLHII